MDKPVRRVRSNGRTIVGLLSSNKNTSVQFESSLEENFLYLLSFDKDVTTYISQPVRISYTDGMGKNRTYVPDFLVEYAGRPSILFEVKTRSWIKDNLQIHRNNNKAAMQFAAERNWEFRVVTDKVLGTIFVRNVRHLFRFHDYPIDHESEDFIRNALKPGGMAIEELVKGNTNKELLILATVWAMLFQKRLSTNLSMNLTMKSIVKLCNDPTKIKYRYL